MSEDAVQALVPHGEDAPPGARADTLSPCAVTYVPGHYERLDGGLHD